MNLVKPWIGRRRQFGLYDQLMVELRNEGPRTFRNFLRMPPEMYDELLDRVGPNITRQRTRYREPLKPGMKLALNLQHLSSRSCYSTMQYGWCVPNNTQSVIVPQVCQAKSTCLKSWSAPLLQRNGVTNLINSCRCRTSPHSCGALDGKHIAFKCPPKSGPQ